MLPEPRVVGAVAARHLVTSWVTTALVTHDGEEDRVWEEIQREESSLPLIVFDPMDTKFECWKTPPTLVYYVDNPKIIAFVWYLIKGVVLTKYNLTRK